MKSKFKFRIRVFDPSDMNTGKISVLSISPNGDMMVTLYEYVVSSGNRHEFDSTNETMRVLDVADSLGLLFGLETTGDVFIDGVWKNLMNSELTQDEIDMIEEEME